MTHRVGAGGLFPAQRNDPNARLLEATALSPGCGEKTQHTHPSRHLRRGMAGGW